MGFWTWRPRGGRDSGCGQIPGDVTFGFTAKSDQNGVKGNCTVIDRTRNVMLKCLDATTYFQTATHATFTGNATVNGTRTTYRITVDGRAGNRRGHVHDHDR